MKLALVNLNRDYGDPPLGLMYIASYLRKCGGFYNTLIVDKEDVIKAIRREKPDVVAFSSMTFEFFESNAIARQVKEQFGIPAIIGGAHISSIPSHLKDSSFDIAVLGEGEQTMLELMQLYERKGSFEAKGLKNVKGIAFKDGNSVTETERRTLLEDLDSIPFPARDLLKLKDYLIPRRAMFPDRLGIYMQMLTSRGCPYRCAFCPSSRFWQKTRFHSAEYVVDEMKEISEKYRSVEGIVIWDDLFIADRQRVKNILELMKKEGLNERFYFSSTARANLMDSEICKILKEMNVKAISFGLESGSEKILNYLKGGNVTVEQNRSAIKIAKELGFFTSGYFIIGSPGETEEDLRQTLSLVRDSNLDTAMVFQLTPFPGTVVWEDAKKAGIVSEDFNFDFSRLFLAYKPKMVMTKEMSQEKFKEWYDIFQKEVAKKGHGRMIRFEPKYLKYALTPYFMKKALLRSRDFLNYLRFSRK